jgi:cell division protein FtsQ
VRGSAATVAGRRLGLRRLVRLPRLSARARRLLIAPAAVCALLGAVYQFWFRDSGLVAVERVTVTGLTTEDAPRVRAALTGAARSMTTLHVDRDELAKAVEAYPVVRDLEANPDFPHTLQIRVVEHHPAAIAVTDGGRVPVAGDGTVLGDLPVEGRLPTITADGTIRGERLEDPDALTAARLAGAAPAPLRGRLETVRLRKEQGLVVLLRDGPELIFGNATRLRAKWTAAVRVLADKAAAGASYIDVRLPGRPAAGGLPAETVTPVAPADTPSSAAPGAGATSQDTPPTSVPGTVPPQPGAVAEPAQPAPVAPQTAGAATAPQAAGPLPPTSGAGGVAAPSP